MHQRSRAAEVHDRTMKRNTTTLAPKRKYCGCGQLVRPRLARPLFFFKKKETAMVWVQSIPLCSMTVSIKVKLYLNKNPTAKGYPFPLF
jgi:hypothetical protein